MLMSGDEAAPETKVTELNPQNIEANPYQPRRTVDEGAQRELVASIAESGIHEPLIVRSTASGKYQLVAGGRRLAAARELDLPTVPVIVRDYSDELAEQVALIENLQRANLRFDDEAVALLKLQERYGLSSTALGRTLGKSADYVDIRLGAARHPDVLQMYSDGLITMQDILPAIRERRRRPSGETPNYSEFTTGTAGEDSAAARAKPAARRPHSGYRAFSNAVNMFARLTEVHQRMGSEERLQAREHALKVREAADRFLALSTDSE
jgi:ParB/RepB/Spo0J family partition protein